jgi:uncharacterized protein (DUF849 family)
MPTAARRLPTRGHQCGPAPDPGPWLRVLVEMIDVPAADAAGMADAVLRRLDESGVTAPRLLRGEGVACWPLIAHAGELGLPTRIGLEDTTVGPTGDPVADNAELVRLALTIWESTRR